MGDIVGGLLGGDDAAQAAAAAQSASAQQAIDLQKKQFMRAQENIDPFIQAGQQALTQEEILLGLAGPEAQQAALDAFAFRPDQLFLQEQGEQAILRNQAAIGGLGGGNVQKELVQFGQGVASQALSDQLNRLASLRTGGLSAASGLGSLGVQTGANVGATLQNQGAAQASGILGAQQADASLFNTAAGLASAFGSFSDKRLKNNIRKIGELESGLGWYSWEWNEKGKELSGCSYGEGVIAQEVQEKFPDAVHERDGYLAVDYEKVA